MRVIAGRFRGRRLRDAPRAGVRPTSDRVREALFAWLGDVSGVRVLDLYAGTGALGIEALSRGARGAVFVERAGPAVAVLHRNLQGLGLADAAGVRVVRAEVGRALRRLGRGGERFDLVFLDPPYEAGALPGALAGLVGEGILGPAAQVVAEASRRHPLPAVPGLALEEVRRWGDTQVGRYRAAPSPQRPPGRPAGPGGARSQRTGRSAPGMMARASGGPLAVFPASFDPVTYGHLDIIRRARSVFDELVLGVATNVSKSGLFSVEERVSLLKEVLRDDSGIRIDVVEGLLVDYARQIGARVVLRGLRAMSDFEYEFEMALMNKHLYPELETVFMMTSQQYFYVSSSRLKELVSFGGDIDDFVPPLVARKLREKLGRG